MPTMCHCLMCSVNWVPSAYITLAMSNISLLQYIRMYVCVYVCIYVCMYVYVYVCMYVCMYVLANHEQV